MKEKLFYPFYIWYEENEKNKEIKKNLKKKGLPTKFLTAITIQNHFILIVYLMIYIIVPLVWLEMFTTGAEDILFGIIYSIIIVSFFLVMATSIHKRTIPKMRKERLKHIGYYDIKEASTNDSEDQIK